MLIEEEVELFEMRKVLIEKIKIQSNQLFILAPQAEGFELTIIL